MGATPKDVTYHRTFRLTSKMPNEHVASWHGEPAELARKFHIITGYRQVGSAVQLVAMTPNGLDQDFAKHATDWERVHSKLASPKGVMSPFVDDNMLVVGHIGWINQSAIYVPIGKNYPKYNISDVVESGDSVYVLERNPMESYYEQYATFEPRRYYHLITSLDGAVVIVLGSEGTAGTIATDGPIDMLSRAGLLIKIAGSAGRKVVPMLVSKTWKRVAASGPTKELAEQSIARTTANETKIVLSSEEYKKALSMVFPSQYLDDVARLVDNIGQKAAVRAVSDPRFTQALASKDWKAAGTYFHTAAKEEARAVSASALPKGWRLTAEETIVAGKGGSRTDVLLRGPKGEIAEFDWKTTGSSALSYTSSKEMIKHAGHIRLYVSGQQTTQQSVSWIDYVRPLVVKQNLQF